MARFYRVLTKAFSGPQTNARPEARFSFLPFREPASLNSVKGRREVFMAIGTAICPTCGARFSVDSDMAMQHVQCPNCGEDIFLEGVDGPASAGTGEAGSSTAKGASPVSDGETSHYRWGRLFIRMVRWIAILVLAVGVFRMAECWLKMQREIQLARERLPSSTEVRHLAEAQQALVRSPAGTCRKL